MKDKAPYYRNYLLTIWAERGRTTPETVTYRFSLKDPRTNHQRGFANLTALVTALLEEIIKAEEARSKGGDSESLN